MHSLRIAILYLLLPAKLWAAGKEDLFYPPWEQLTGPAPTDTIDSLLRSSDKVWERLRNPILPLQKGPHWARVTVGTEEAGQRLILEDAWAPTNFIEVFVIHEGRIIAQFAAGDQEPSPKGFLQHHRYPAFELNLPPGLSTLYIRYDTDDIPGVRAVLWQPAAFEAHRIREIFALGGTLGILLIMSLYNLIIYLVVRIKAYIYYSFYVLSFLCFEFCIQGLASQMIVRSTWLNGEAVLISAMIALIFAMLFTEHFLDLDKKIPQSRRFTFVLKILCALNVILTTVHLQAGNMVGIFINIVVVFWIISVAARMALQHQMQAYVMLSAWTVFLAGNTWSMLYFLGIIPPGYGGPWVMLIGADFEVMTLSLGLALYMARLRREKAKVLSNIEAATRFQETLLGQSHPHRCLEVASFFRPADHIGGDWYDIASLGNERYSFLFVGDVTGHGLSSTLLSSAVSGCIRSTLYGYESTPVLDPGILLQEIAKRANRIVVDAGSKDGCFMSMIMICIDLKEMQAYYLNAGHPHPFLTAEHSTFLVSRGSLLGMKVDPDFEIKKKAVAPGNTLTLYTDGALECLTRDKTLLSQRAFTRLLLAHPTAAGAVQAIRESFDLTQGPLNDDITVLSVQIIERAA